MPIKSNVRVAAVIAAVFAVAPAYVLAQEAGNDPDRILSDPLYLPLKGQIYGSSAYDHSVAKGDVFDSTGAPKFSFRTRTDALRQSLAYGVTDDLTVRLNLGYDPSVRRTDDLFGGGTIQRDRSGFTNPSFGVTWRALDQRDHGFDLDLFGSYAPDIVSARSPDASGGGTVAFGGPTATLGVDIGRVMSRFTIDAFARADFAGRRDVLDQPTGDITTSDAHWNYAIGLNTQTRIAPRWSVNAGLAYAFNTSFDVAHSISGVTHVSNPGDTTNANLALNYHFIPNKLVGSLTYQHDFSGNSTEMFAVTPASNTTTRNQQADVLGVRLDYTF